MPDRPIVQQVCARLPARLAADLAAIVRARGVRSSHVVREAIADFVRKNATEVSASDTKPQSTH